MANGFLSDKKRRDNKIKKFIECSMIDNDMSQADVARAMGKTQQWFSYNLKNASFSLSEIVALGHVLNIDWSKLGRILND